jgi:hypothetical protein
MLFISAEFDPEEPVLRAVTNSPPVSMLPGPTGIPGLCSRIVQRASRILRLWLHQVIRGVSFRIADHPETIGL